MHTKSLHRTLPRTRGSNFVRAAGLCAALLCGLLLAGAASGGWRAGARTAAPLSSPAETAGR